MSVAVRRFVGCHCAGREPDCWDCQGSGLVPAPLSNAQLADLMLAGIEADRLAGRWPALPDGPSCARCHDSGLVGPDSFGNYDLCPVCGEAREAERERRDERAAHASLYPTRGRRIAAVTKNAPGRAASASRG